MKLHSNPRCLVEASSAVKAMLPVYSPPTDKPCTMRSTTSSTVAMPPHCVRVGRTPISRLLPPINIRLRNSIRLRPYRSASGPSTRLPIGRIRNPTANTAKELSNAAELDSAGKKASPSGCAR